MATLTEDLTKLDREMAVEAADNVSRPASVRDAVLAVATRLREHREADDLNAIGALVLGICPKFFAQGKSIEALPLALALHERTKTMEESALAARAAGACGVLFADTGDFSSSLDYQSFALKLGERAGDPVALSRAWNNIGLAFGNSGNPEKAISSYQRGIDQSEELPGAQQNRYIAHMNLAIDHQRLREPEIGLPHAYLALDEHKTGKTIIEPSSQALLFRALVRLCLDTGQPEEAKAHLSSLTNLTRSHPSTRAQLILDTSIAAVELASGRGDIALTRLEIALTASRFSQMTLKDALVSLVRAESLVGTAGRAIIRLRELSELAHSNNVTNAKNHRQLRLWRPTDETYLPSFDGFVAAQLHCQLKSPSAPEDWNVLSRLAIGTSLQIDGNGAHGLRVAALTEMLAQAMGFTPIDAIEMGCAAQLHDIGTAYDHQNLLPAHAAAHATEMPSTRDHCESGWQVLADDMHPRLLMAREIARYHHSHWDGSGYPSGVASQAIPIHARICAVADAFDALLCEAKPGSAYSMLEALEDLRGMSGSRLEPRLVDGFITALQGEARLEGIDVAATNGLANLQQFVESFSRSRNYI
jgi:putative two-component system response regulator